MLGREKTERPALIALVTVESNGSLVWEFLSSQIINQRLEHPKSMYHAWHFLRKEGFKKKHTRRSISFGVCIQRGLSKCSGNFRHKIGPPEKKKKKMRLFIFCWSDFLYYVKYPARHGKQLDRWTLVYAVQSSGTLG